MYIIINLPSYSCTRYLAPLRVLSTRVRRLISNPEIWLFGCLLTVMKNCVVFHSPHIFQKFMEHPKVIAEHKKHLCQAEQMYFSRFVRFAMDHSFNASCVKVIAVLLKQKDMLIWMHLTSECRRQQDYPCCNRQNTAKKGNRRRQGLRRCSHETPYMHGDKSEEDENGEENVEGLNTLRRLLWMSPCLSTPPWYMQKIFLVLKCLCYSLAAV